MSPDHSVSSGTSPDRRMGMVLDSEDLERARAADDAGVPAVLVSGPSGSEVLRAVAVACHTRWARIAVVVHFDTEDPVTLAEEIAVADNLSGGRIIVVAEGASVESLELFRAALAGELVRGVTVIPPPVQPEVPIRSTEWAAARFTRWDGPPADLVRRSAPDIVRQLSAHFEALPGGG